jgi:SNF2 family DNA or RNA helicase
MVSYWNSVRCFHSVTVTVKLMMYRRLILESKLIRIQNDILDLHALFEFLGTIVKPMNELAKFKETICQPIKAGRSKMAMSRLTVRLSI